MPKLGKLTTKAHYVERGYGQVEPNHLSAQRTGQIYAQLPADSSIDVLEQGQFVKYNYRKGVVDFEGKGEWMLVYNEIKLYREGQLDCEFAMVKDNYGASIYSPVDGIVNYDAKSRDYSGITVADDMYEMHYNNDPFHVESKAAAKKMPEGTSMVPRVFKTNVGDIFTTNTIFDTELELGDTLAPGADGILAKTESEDGMLWQVVKLYTMPDRQKGVKLVRIQ